MKNYAFIDGNNLYLGLLNQGVTPNYAKLRRYLRDKFNVEHAYLFIGYDPSRIDYYNYLRSKGYILVFKPTVTYRDDMGIRRMKGNVDAELVLYASAIEYAHYDKAIIISGDGDFACLVEFLSKRGKLDTVITPTIKYSSLLKKYNNYILVMTDIIDKVADN